MSRAALFLLAWVTSTACGLDEFEVVLEDQATIPGTFNAGNPFTLEYGALSGLNLAAQKDFVNNDVDPSDVDAIFVQSATIEGVDPQKDDLSILLESAKFEISAPELERKTLAEKTGFASGPSSPMDFDSTLNLKPWATAPSMTIDADIVLKQKPVLQTTLRSTIVLLVDINLAGI